VRPEARAGGLDLGKLFGTDGVREIANKLLTPEMAFRLGRAGASVVAPRNGRRQVIVIGGDTRRSTGMLGSALSAGINSAGVDVLDVGVIPTPAIAYLTVKLNADAGIVVSASHNSAEYNGIKFFGPDGFKIPDEMEHEIEKRVWARATGTPGSAAWSENDDLPRPSGSSVGMCEDIQDAWELYVEHAVESARHGLDGLRVVLDCANGASCVTTPAAFRELGATVVVINASPDGDNINSACGSTHPQALAAAVVEHSADMGFAHDGDADRVIAVDADGNVVDGDQIMAICAVHRHFQGGLPGRAIVATNYSNLGLAHAMESIGCSVLRADAGDRYVLQMMLEKNLVIGGEQSGHVIFLETTTTGDGLITAIEVATVVASTGKPLAELAGVMKKYPQVMVNVGVARKEDYHRSKRIASAIEAAEAELGSDGRLLVRPSGTEPVVRVMGEGKDEGEVRRVVESLAEIIESELC
jgi:phosphoglucosamine mutase